MGDHTIPGAGSPAPGAPRPDVLAESDQHLAELRDLVTLARQHRDAYACANPVPCPGSWVARLIAEMRPAARARLLGTAIAELAALGYGQPTTADAYWLTERARRAVDGPDGGSR